MLRLTHVPLLKLVLPCPLVVKDYFRILRLHMVNNILNMLQLFGSPLKLSGSWISMIFVGPFQLNYYC